MRSSQYFILAMIISIASIQSTYADGVFKWKDARGNTQYGDEPPANAKLDKFKMPEIMVIDGFKEQWKPLADDASKAVANKKPISQNYAKAFNKTSVYNKLAFIAPRNNQIIKSGFNGDVSAMISIKPPLKKTHRVVFELDGKTVAKGKSRINNFSNLGAGKHRVLTKIIDKHGNVLKTSSPISFSVVRN
jgi:hypothetical protein